MINHDKLVMDWWVFTNKPIDFGQVLRLTSRAASSSSFLFSSRSAAACAGRGKFPGILPGGAVQKHRLERGMPESATKDPEPLLEKLGPISILIWSVFLATSHPATKRVWYGSTLSTQNSALSNSLSPPPLNDMDRNLTEICLYAV